MQSSWNKSASSVWFRLLLAPGGAKTIARAHPRPQPALMNHCSPKRSNEYPLAGQPVRRLGYISLRTPSKLLLGRCAQFIEQSSQSFCFVDFSSLQFRAQSKHDCRNPILSRHFCIAKISRRYQILTLCRAQRSCPLLRRIAAISSTIFGIAATAASRTTRP